jgi:hypothetical protein
MAMRSWQAAVVGIGCCGQKLMFGKITQGNSKTIHYSVRSDSRYKLEVEFLSGRTLQQDWSVTRGLDVLGFDFERHEVSLTSYFQMCIGRSPGRHLSFSFEANREDDG